MFYLKKITNEINEIKKEINTNDRITQNELAEIWNKLDEHINANNRVIRDAKKDFENLENKTKEDFENLENKTKYFQKEISNLKKENEMLLNGLNETRLAVKQIATILYNKGIIKLKEENKNERNNTKPKYSKQNISKHC